MAKTKQERMGAMKLISEMRHDKYEDQENHFIKSIVVLGLPNTKRAARILIEEMSIEKGYQRRDGRPYYVHPIAVAQTALDFDIINDLIEIGESETADIILTACLLHDIIEDVPGYTVERIASLFTPEIAHIVDNLTKNKKEPFDRYIQRVSSHSVSALVKILDRLNNVSTLDTSTLEKREEQLYETRDIYLPLTKIYRHRYWEYSNFYFQARSIMTSMLNLIEKWNETEKELNKYTQ